MVNYGTTFSTVKPEKMKVDDYSVWIAENISEETVTPTMGEEQPYTQYKYTLIQYDKNEYIDKLHQEVNELTDCLLEMSEIVYQ